MRRHAALKHSEEWSKINESQDQPTVANFFKPKSELKKYKVNSERRKILNRKLVQYIAKDMRPINVTTDSGFREFVRELDPKYVLPTPKTIRQKLIPRLYNEVMVETQNQLSRIKYVSLTTDGWTSFATDKYNCFTIHYVDWSVPEPKLQTKVLECAPFDERNYSIELEKELRRVTTKHNVTEKLVLTIADNASDIQKALELFGKPKIGCIAHKINIAAKTCIEECSKANALKKKLAKIVRKTKISSPASKMFRKCLKQVGITGKIALISFVKTRFNSVYLMVNRALETKDALILYFAKYNIANPLNDDDWKLVEDLAKVLRPLYLFTREMSAEKSTTLSKVIPLVSMMLKAYAPNQVKHKNDSKTAKELRKKILESLKSKFNGIESDPIYTNSSIFDPRFKDLVFATKNDAQVATTVAKAEAVKIAHESEELPDESDNENEINATNYDDETDELWDSFDKQKVKKSKRSKVIDYQSECVELEMRKYLSLPKLDRKDDPIKWWKTVGEKQFPMLFKAAQKYQCMIATSVPSERIFSKAGHIINKKRSALDKNTANYLITLSTNLQ